jgi:hypothetical protein
MKTEASPASPASQSPQIHPGLADYFQKLYDRIPYTIIRRFQMPFWQRLLYTVIVIVVTSFVAGLIWHRLFGFSLPGYVGGVIGGLTALPFWELLKRKGSKEN